MLPNETNSIEDMESQNENATEKLKMKEKIAYGFGMIALNLLSMMAGFASYFYTEIVGIGIATVGTILFISRLLDGVTDVAMGMVVDNTKSKYGRARPWLLWSAVPFGISIVLLFIAPEIGMTGKVVFAFLTYNIATSIMYTVSGIPHMTLMSTMTQDQFQRDQLSIYKTAMGALGGMGISASVLPLVSFYGGGKQGWFLMAVTYGILATTILLLVFKNTKERILVVPQQNKQTNKIHIRQSLQALIKNKYWLIVVGMALLVSFLGGVRGGVDVYYADYILGNANLVGVMAAAGTIPMLIVIILIGPLMKRFSKRNLSIAGFVFAIVGSLIILINPESLLYVVIGKASAGAAMVLLGVALTAMIADTVVYGEWKTGIRNEGVLFGAESFGLKVGGGFGALAMGWLMGLGGYVGGQATQTPEAIFMIKFISLHMTIITGIIAIILLLFYKLDKIYPQINAELKERRNNV